MTIQSHPEPKIIKVCMMETRISVTYSKYIFVWMVMEVLFNISQFTALQSWQNSPEKGSSTLSISKYPKKRTGYSFYSPKFITIDLVQKYCYFSINNCPHPCTILLWPRQALPLWMCIIHRYSSNDKCPTSFMTWIKINQIFITSCDWLFIKLNWLLENIRKKWLNWFGSMFSFGKIRVSVSWQNMTL